MSSNSQAKTSNGQQYKFAQLHSPKMKSVYWRYFGFPTHDNGKIITKSNVVCTICHRVLTNHGNTTNLRAHLQHRHKELFQQMVLENNLKVPQRKTLVKSGDGNVKKKTKKKTKLENSEGRVKIEYIEMEETETEPFSTTEEEQTSMLYEAIVPLTYDDDENIDTEHFHKVEVGNPIGDAVHGNCSSSQDTEIVNENSLTNAIEVPLPRINYRVQLVEDNPYNQYKLQESLLNLITQDLHSLESLYDTGMNRVLRYLLTENTGCFAKDKIESAIREMHSDKFTELSSHIKSHSQANAYSLSFEIWRNIERKNFLTVYYNCTAQTAEPSFLNQLYCTFEYNKYTNIESIFVDFNVDNCAAAVVNYDYDDYLTQYLKSKNIPVIVSFDVVINKCLRDTLALSAVASIVDEVNDVIMRFQSEMTSKSIEIPAYNDEFPWSCFEVLKFFSETVSWPEDLEFVVKSAKTLVDTFNILNLTIETLRSEEVPFSSLVSPFVARILNKQYVVSDTDEELVKQIKTNISKLLQKFVLEDDNLTISALLDPRFHRLINVSNLNQCIQVLNDKYNKINIFDDLICLKKRDPTISTVDPSDGAKIASETKKSNLKIFFDISDNNDGNTETVENTIEYELERYQKEVHVALDESPLIWWNKMGHIYNTLRQVALHYQSIPCVINMEYKKTFQEQIRFQRKRFMLSGSLLDAIVFLNHHQNHLSMIK